MSFGQQPWSGPPPHHHPDPRTTAHARPPAAHEHDDAEEAARLSVGLRIGARIAVVWSVYVTGAALVPGGYGAPVAGTVSLGAVLALVPLGAGVHGVVAYGRRVDRAAAADAEHRRWS
ncbi:hypothetical protein ABZ767_12975 [Streptomyces pseudogriseolus]|uniref:hypothetical protein n=1 Tax=Streptomyces pseudogriseolus TaxID=36817 RepID=UPI00348397FE